jgi:hypothetical protein
MTEIILPPLPESDDEDDIGEYDVEQEMRKIEKQFEELTSNDKIEKPFALKIMKLHHVMVTIILKTIHEKNKEIEKLTFDLKTVGMQHENAVLHRNEKDYKKEHEDLVEKHRQDSEQFNQQIMEQNELINRLQEAQAQRTKKR